MCPKGHPQELLGFPAHEFLPHAGRNRPLRVPNCSTAEALSDATGIRPNNRCFVMFLRPISSDSTQPRSTTHYVAECLKIPCRQSLETHWNLDIHPTQIPQAHGILANRKYPVERSDSMGRSMRLLTTPSTGLHVAFGSSDGADSS